MSRRAAAADSKRVTWSRWVTSGWRSVERLSAGLAPGQLPQLRRRHGPARPRTERGRGGQRPGEDEPARGRRLQRHGHFAPHPEGERGRPVGLRLYPDRGPHRPRRLPGRTRRGIGYAPGQKKRITVDGVPAPSLTNFAAGGAGARVVTFFPDDIRVVKGAPADRREFLDALLSSLRPAYARAAVEYARAVQQRNQLLRRIRDGYSS